MNNILKYSLKLAIVIVGVTLFTRCNDDFLNKYPETSITEKVFFQNPKDLELYTNNFYGLISSNYWDVASDNNVYIEESGIYKMMRNETNSTNAGLWKDYWTIIRNINFMLARTDKVQGDVKQTNHYIGLARMFRANYYYGMVKKYSDVPWYGRDLKTSDAELLYKTQDSRKDVVDSIMADLDFAVKNMNDVSGNTRHSKYTALAIQARIALHEGTFRKYHSELSLTDADRFLKIAEVATEQIMKSGKYEISTAMNGEIQAYEALFCNLNLTNNKEVIFAEDYDKALNRKHNAQAMFDWTSGLSRDLMEDYLAVKDGKAVPFQQIEGYATMNVHQVFENRDPRLEQTFMKPGFFRPGATSAYIPKMGAGGYPQVKFSPRTLDQISWNASYTDLPAIRYAEMLLINAEAKAELGTLTQSDLDQTINHLRDRVSMPNANLADWMANIDPVQSARYPKVTSSQKGAILEIRRERRIELACEGYRYDDLYRWASGKLFEQAPEGTYIAGYGLYDLNGDGKFDVAIMKNKADADTISKDIKEKNKLVIYNLEKESFELSEGSKGYIRLKAQVNKFTFNEPKYYYYPIDDKDIMVNSNLIQNKYWK